jgi:hypothetical protein
MTPMKKKTGADSSSSSYDLDCSNQNQHHAAAASNGINRQERDLEESESSDAMNDQSSARSTTFDSILLEAMLMQSASSAGANGAFNVSFASASRLQFPVLTCDNGNVFQREHQEQQQHHFIQAADNSRSTSSWARRRQRRQDASTRQRNPNKGSLHQG